MKPQLVKPHVIRAVIYVRISQDQTGKEEGIERQEERCRALCVARGWEVVAVIPDNSKSAWSGRKRPGFERVLDWARHGECDVIVSVAIDRITRTLSDLAKLIDSAKTHGVGVVTTDGKLDLTTASGRLVATILTAVAASEMEIKSQRQKLANDSKARKGGRTKGIRPFGYADDGITIVEEEAEMLREAAQTILAGGSLGGVARQWAAAGILGPKRKDHPRTPYTSSGIRNMLESPRYIGKREYLGEIVADAQWKPILEPSTYYAVKEILDNPSRLISNHSRKGGPTPTTLLANLATCSKCNGRTRGSTARISGGVVIPVFTCRDKKCCSVPRAEATAYVEQEILAWLETGVDKLLANDDKDLDINAMQRELEALRTRKKGIGRAIATGEMDQDVALEAQSVANEMIDALTEKLALAGRGTQFEGLAEAPSPYEWWQGLGLLRQREVLRAIADVKFNPQPLQPGRAFKMSGWHEGLVTIIPK